MPTSLRKQLELGAKVSVINQINQDGRLVRIETIANEFQGILPVIGQLCEQDAALARVYLCHPDVTYVVKMAKEGGFCGYRNIQMLVSYIRDARSEGHQRFSGRLPSILQLQDMIETAWDRGFNEIGRVETGGIRDTRKYIGTPEVSSPSLACVSPLMSKGPSFTAELRYRVNVQDTHLSSWILKSVRCIANNFGNRTDVAIEQQLLNAVEQYFLNGRPNLSNKVCRTSLPPVYFQHPGKRENYLIFCILCLRLTPCRPLIDHRGA